MYHDPEINAMSEVLEALKDLNRPQIKRILDWTTSKFGVAESEIMQQPAVEQPVEVSTATVVQPVVEEPVAVSVEPADQDSIAADITEPQADSKTRPIDTKGLGLKRYKTIENLFLVANVTTVASRILLTAAYLQEKMGFTEVSSFDINSRLKKLGYGVSNITTAINGLLNKKPPRMTQTKKEGDSKQAKRKFVVTEEGINVAKTYLTSSSG